MNSTFFNLDLVLLMMFFCGDAIRWAKLYQQQQQKKIGNYEKEKKWSHRKLNNRIFICSCAFSLQSILHTVNSRAYVLHRDRNVTSLFFISFFFAIERLVWDVCKCFRFASPLIPNLFRWFYVDWVCRYGVCFFLYFCVAHTFVSRLGISIDAFIFFFCNWINACICTRKDFACKIIVITFRNGFYLFGICLSVESCILHNLHYSLSLQPALSLCACTLLLCSMFIRVVFFLFQTMFCSLLLWIKTMFIRFSSPLFGV